MMEVFKILKFLVLLAVPFALLYFLMYSYTAWRSPLSSEEMDLDGDGKVSFVEADYFGNFETREFVQEGKQCKQYIAIKDGRTLKTICE